MLHLIRAGLRRQPLRNLAAAVVALVAAGALFATLLLMTGMGRALQSDLDRLGADLVVVPKGQAEAVRPLLAGGKAQPIPETVSVDEWKKLLKQGRVVGIKRVQGWSLARGGAGAPAGATASILLITLERWASPLIAVQEVTAAIPGAEVVVAEQATRQVTRNTQPIVRLLTVASSVALLGAVLMAGLLASIRLAERRGQLGMMRAMGASRAFLVGLSLCETAILTLAGAVPGVALALPAMVPVSFARELIYTVPMREMLLLAGGAAGLTLVVTVIAALGPALRAASLDPLDAIRRGR